MLLWDYFNSIAIDVSGGRFIPNEFEFIEGELWLSELKPVLYTIFAYYIIVWGGQALLKKTKPFKLDILAKIHNLFLTLASLFLLILMIEQLIPMIKSNGIFYSICNEKAWSKEMVTLYYINYIVKFIEFIDTFFLVLKHKKLTFLHTYHHGATALLCYTQLIGKTSTSWVPITLNLAVHVIMYWYYFLSSFNIKILWKEWVTRLQIIQFILDICIIYFVIYQKLVFEYFNDYGLPVCNHCAGTTKAMVWGCTIVTSYLILFVAFYRHNYKRKKARKEKNKKNKSKNKKHHHHRHHDNIETVETDRKVAVSTGIEEASSNAKRRT